ncbi:hypothetical protein [Mangrovibacillus cuniculi]|uniref:Uncharacterized protein n=1 Tax=Mangrovibacillus cuniculi TaxID=2593652 RepID=A0A7S8HGB3_9BACI|nr:hypothetical protein [Mangrovibacillus cuniculi]QPC47361.1 hypothetical protein G8O30_10580 [Mangrovibacillus cuniculi]
MKFVNKLNKLFNKVDETETKYMKALEQKEEKLLAMRFELQEQEALLQDVHKMALLGDVSEETFEERKAEVDKLKDQVRQAEKEVHLIQEYKTDDIKAVIAELEEEKKKLTKDKGKELQSIQRDLIEAKQAYLDTLVKISGRYKELVEPDKKLESLKVKLGLQVRNYITGAGESLNMISHGADYIPLRVEQYEVYEALTYGRTPVNLKQYLNK